MTERTGASWLVYALGALCAGAIVAAVLVVGPASSSQATRHPHRDRRAGRRAVDRLRQRQPAGRSAS